MAPRTVAAVVAGCGVASAVAVARWGPVELGVTVANVTWGVYLDRVSAVLLLFVGCLSWLVVSYARTNLRGQRRLPRFSATFTIVVVALAVMVSGSNLALTAAGWTASGLAFARLVAHPDTAAARRAARYIRRRLLFGDVAVWVGVVTAVATLPTIDRARLAAGSPLVTLIVVAALVAAGVVRSSLVPFHRWLPETAEAPSPVSALLHAGLVNGAGVLALLCWPLFSAAPVALAVLVVLGAASVVVGTFTGRLRADVKGQLACSTTAQMGYMAVQIGLGLPAAALLHLIGHGCYKAWLFLRAGGAITRNRTGYAAASAASRGRSWPWAVVAGTLAAGGGLPAALMQTAGITGWVPYVLAVSGATVAGRGAGRQGAVWYRRGLVTLFAGLGAAGYVWVLLWWEGLFATALPLGPVWSAALAWPIVVALLAVGFATARVAAGLSPTASGWLATALSSTGIPPWSSTVGAWTRLGRARPAGPAPAQTAVTDPDQAAAVVSLVSAAGAIVAPAWPLREMVAANPLAGLTMLPFDDAVSLVEGTHRATAHLPLRDYLELFDTNRVTTADLAVALGEHDAEADAEDDAEEDAEEDGSARPREERRRESLDGFVRECRAHVSAGGARPGPATPPLLPPRLCEGVGVAPHRRAGVTVTLAEVVDDHTAWWTQRAWTRAASRGPGPWKLWRTAAARPVYDRVIGVRGASTWVGTLPRDPAAAIAHLLRQIGLAPQDAVGYVCAVLAAAPGWAGHAQWRSRQHAILTPLLELCAVRIAFDLLLTGHGPIDSSSVARLGQLRPIPLSLRPPPAATSEHRRERVWQRAWELNVHRRLLAQITDQPQVPAERTSGRRSAQVVFCIDVRSERVRRALEADGCVQTFGFAGFFGATIRYHDSFGAEFDQCPALVRPTASLIGTRDPLTIRQVAHRSTTTVTATPLLPLPVAEGAGLLSGLASLAATVAPRRWRRTADRWTRPGDAWGRNGLSRPPTDHASASTDDGVLPGLSEDDQADIAATVLTTIGLVAGFAPLLVICGHEATVTNNAFSAAYDCGACGGNTGRINAGVLAAILNEPCVRERLAARGIAIPDDTLAVAAVHNTTTDAVDLDPHSSGGPDHHDALDAFRRRAVTATSQAAAAHAVTLPARHRRPLDRDTPLVSRSADWSEPMPEWGLAGNAAMVVGPRRLTADLDLGGRVFLHCYDASLDSLQHTILEQILTAPVVVGQWINAQYYFSTISPRTFGAGDKTTHNVVGDVGVVTGSHGDLRTGLPWQSVAPVDPGHEPLGSIHEPVRLLVLVAARPQAVAAVLQRNTDLYTLLANRWLRMVCLPPGGLTPVELTHDLATVPVAGRPTWPDEIHQNDRAVAEQVMAAGEGEHGRPVELVLGGGPPAHGASDPADRRDLAAHGPGELARVDPEGQLREVEQPGHVIPVQMRSQREVHLLDHDADPVQRRADVEHPRRRRDRDPQGDRQLRDRPGPDPGADTRIDHEGAVGMLDDESRHGVAERARAGDALGDERRRDRPGHLRQRTNRDVDPAGWQPRIHEPGEKLPINRRRPSQTARQPGDRPAADRDARRPHLVHADEL